MLICIMFTDQDITNEILLKKAHIKQNVRDIYTELENLFNGALEREALEHSLRIEYPFVGALMDKKDITNNSRYTNDLKRFGEQLKIAWDFGKKNFSMPFDKAFLVELAYQIDPDPFNLTGKIKKDYRDTGVQIRGSTIRPPSYAEKVNLEMERFFKALKELYESAKTKENAVSERYFDLGAWIHFNLVRIHPFFDNNGRTSRMAQNLYLRSSNSFPPIIIYEGERKDYECHLERALEGFRERDGSKYLSAQRDEISRGEKEFYDYMGGKLNTILDRVISNKH